MSESCCPKDAHDRKIPKPLYLCALFFAAVYFLPFVWPQGEAYREAFFQYANLLWAPILIGLLLGGAIDTWVSDGFFSRHLNGANPGSILNAVLLGFISTACCHGVMALAVSLYKKGASRSCVVAFLLASPWSNLPLTFLLILFFGAKALLFILGAFFIALTTGWLFACFEKAGWIPPNPNTVSLSEQSSVKFFVRQEFARGIKRSINNSYDLFKKVVPWIFVGISCAALANAFIPASFFKDYLAGDLKGLFATLAGATVLEVCSEGMAPLVIELYRQTGALGNAFVFLMAGVATDLTEISVLWGTIGRRSALLVPAIVVPQTLVIGFLANQIF